jgi:hypothetical protein
MTKSNIAQPIERDETQILEVIEAERAALSDAQREMGELQLRRREMLTTAGVDEVQDTDTIISRAATKVDIAQARIVGLEGELAGLRAAKPDAQLAANLARARQLAEEARQLIVGNYAEAARAIAETLARLETIESEVHALNARLPPGTADIRIEAFRGYSATLGATVVLPGITAGDAAFWPTRPRRLTLNEIYARD